MSMVTEKVTKTSKAEEVKAEASSVLMEVAGRGDERPEGEPGAVRFRPVTVVNAGLRSCWS